ncbi:MAG: hypothetical protein WB646_13000 [Steroidobacteraceae bacterium]
MASETEENAVPPYVAYKTFKTLLRMIAPAIPSRIDKHVMPTFSGATQSQVIQALKYLKLIDEIGVPTEKLSGLVKVLDNKEEFLEYLFNLIDESYPFLRGFDHTSGTDGQLNEAFAKVASGDTARKCKSFYLAAMKDGGAVLSPYIKEPGRRGPVPGSKRARPVKEKGDTSKVHSEDRAEYVVHRPPPSASNVHPALQGMLQELPKSGSEWGTAQKDAFTKAFRTILDVIYPSPAA